MERDLLNKRILLLHGLTSSPRVFDKLVNNLENRGCYCFAPTLTGHRNNHPYSKEVCLHNYVSELEEYINYITLGGRHQIQVLGVSFGALLSLRAIFKSSNLIDKIILVSPPVEFRNLSTRFILPFLRYLPGILGRNLGSIPKSKVSSFSHDSSASYSVNELSVMSKLRYQVLTEKLKFNNPSLLIQSSYDHHINPYSLYFLKNEIFGDRAKIVLRDWGSSHDILASEDAVSIIANFIMD